MRAGPTTSRRRRRAPPRDGRFPHRYGLVSCRPSFDLAHSSTSLSQRCAAERHEIVRPMHEETEQDQPDQEQEVPVDGAELHTEAEFANRAWGACLWSVECPRGRPAECDEAAQDVQAMDRSDEVEE